MAYNTGGTRIAAKYVEKAITDEWFAQFQYWIGSVIISKEWEDIISQFKEHSRDEYDHATDLGRWIRMVPRDGKLPYALSELPKKQYCGYIYPSGNTPDSLVSDAATAEQCAINFYGMALADISRIEYYGSDLGEILERILEKEKEHLRDLEILARYNYKYSFFF